MKYLYIYLILISIVAFAMMGIDKYRACRHRWRIPERTLFLTAVLGGSPGAILGMFLFRHKTRHKLFAVGLPVVLAIQLVLFFVLRKALL